MSYAQAAWLLCSYFRPFVLIFLSGYRSLAALLRDIETAAQGGRALPPPELFETRWVEADQALTDMLAAVHQGAATESGPL